MSFSGASTKGKLCGISVLNATRIILKKMNVSFIVNFCLGKYNFNHVTFGTQHLSCSNESESLSAQIMESRIRVRI